jgi:hypothetical protein
MIVGGPLKVALNTIALNPYCNISGDPCDWEEGQHQALHFCHPLILHRLLSLLKACRQILLHKVVSSTPRLSGIRTHNVSGDRH